jgi:hypothetical protein
VDDETFLIFVASGEGSIMSWLEKYADVRRYDDVYGRDRWIARYSDLDEGHISQVLSEYRRRAETYEDPGIDISLAIDTTLEKLSLLRESQSITDEMVESSISLGQ